MLQRTSVASEVIDGCTSNYNINIYTVNSKALPKYISILFRTIDVYEKLKSTVSEKGNNSGIENNIKI